MQISTLLTLTFATLVLGTDNHPTVTKCQTITSTIYSNNQSVTCAIPACLEVKPVTQKCGCPPIETTTVQATGCPSGRCGGTSYITAIEDCFPTQPPSSTVTTTSHPVTTTSASSSTTSASPPPESTHPTIPPHSSSTSKSHPPHSSTTSPPHEPHSTTTPPSQNPYTNTTKTVTTTEHSTTILTTCPPKHACTGETVTVTSTEFCMCISQIHITLTFSYIHHHLTID